MSDVFFYDSISLHILFKCSWNTTPLIYIKWHSTLSLIISDSAAIKMWNQAIHGFIRLTSGGQFYLRGKAMQIAENKTPLEIVRWLAWGIIRWLSAQVWLENTEPIKPNLIMYL